MDQKPPEPPQADEEGWARFERAVDAALRSPPKPAPKKDEPKRKRSAKP
jgi:hypothetical protein